LDNLNDTSGPNLTALTISNHDFNQETIMGNIGLFAHQVVKKDKDKIEKLDLMFLK
jgi:hypothetical protein